MKKIAYHSLLLLLICTFSFSLFTPAQTSQAKPGDGFELVGSSSQALELIYHLPQYKIVQATIDGKTCDRVEAQGMGWVNMPGKPQLPIQGAWLGLPPQGEASYEILAQEQMLYTKPLHLCPAATPFADYSLDGALLRSGQRWVWDEDAYTSHQFSPSRLVSLENAGQIRSIRLALLSLAPFQYRASDGTLLITTSLRLRLNFPHTPRPATQERPAMPESAVYKAYFDQLLLNADQVRSWNAMPGEVPAAQPVLTQVENGAQELKIMVNQDGIYALSYTDLQAAGVPVDSLLPQQFKLFNLGNEVSIYVSGEGDGKFEPGDFVLFYGQQMRTRFTNTNVYWLSWGAGNGMRMASLNGTPGTPATLQTRFNTSVHLETDRYYLSCCTSGPTNDHWQWDYLQVTSANVSKNFTRVLNHISVEAGQVVVRGLLYGYSSNLDQRARIYLNGKQLTELTWQAGQSISFEVLAAQADLLEGTNTITVEALYGGGITSQVIYVNWFEIGYYDTYVAEADLLNFDGDAAGDLEYRVTNFSSPSIEAYDITDPSHPLRILNAEISDQGGTYQYRFKHSIANEHHYLALTTANRLSPNQMVLDSGSTLKSSANLADYLVITHADFTTQANQLATYRQGDGLKTMVVQVQDIYDEFSYGIFDPVAIHAFLAYAYQSWQKPAPSFVLLLGDGHYDFKNLLNYNQGNFIPPYMGEYDPYSGEVGSDNRYVTISGSDNLPDMFIGRLPARTTVEAQAMLDKITYYEQNPPTDGWNEKVTFVTDNPDEANPFYDLSNQALALLPATYTWEKIYYGQNYTDVPTTKAAIINAVNQGRLIMNYIGHGSTQWWASEKLFEQNDIASLTNTGKYPFMVAMTCLEGRFFLPSASSQAFEESLLRASGKGTIAGFTPVGLGIATGHDLLQAGLFLALFEQDVYQLGPATTRSKEYLYANTIGYRDLLDTYLLLGDPALQLNSLEALSSKYLYLPILIR